MAKKSRNQKVILATILIMILLGVVLLMGKFTYSFLGPDESEDITSKGEVTASEDRLIFSEGQTLSLNATTDNFNTSSGNITSTVNPNVRIVKNVKNETAEATYFAGIEIKKNTYKYSTTDKKAELILTIRDENGEITTAEGLNYVTVNGISGFDITEKKGIYNIVKDHPISTTSSTTGTTHTWTFTLTFVNFETDQSINENANLEMNVILQKDKIPSTIAEVCVGQNMAECIKNNYYLDSTIYLHDSNLANGAEDGSYRYAGASDIVNNYVCFGSDLETCPVDNLYRVIGVFDGRVKLIKADYAKKELLSENGDYYNEVTPPSTYKGSQTTIAKYYWNYKNDTTINSGKGSNDWSTSLLNKVNLNTNYLNNIGSVWASKIAMTTWYLGGYNTSSVTAKAMYGYERGSTVASGNPTTYEAKVGLMYPSDYGFATMQDDWKNTLNLYNETNITNNNWLYLGEYEITITPNSNFASNVFDLEKEGNVGYPLLYYAFAIRPVFYLESSVILISGEGTKTSPYRIN